MPETHDVTNVVLLPIDATLPILLFIFVCLVFPGMVKHRQQFYAALGFILLRMFLASIAGVFNSINLHQLSAGLGGLIEIATIVLLVMSVGGLSAKQLIGEFSDAVDAIRHPEYKPSGIVPITGARPKLKDIDEEDEHKVYTINTPKDEGSVPMD